MAKVAVNPGHYPGEDCGAVGPAGLEEADVAMAVAEGLQNCLEKDGHQVVFISENELAAIVKTANQSGIDVFVSIHCNGAKKSTAQGTETWCYEYSQQSYRLAREIQQELVNALELPDRGVKFSSGLYVLKYAEAPAALAELAFITNPAEEELLADKVFQAKAAAAIARGIAVWLADE